MNTQVWHVKDDQAPSGRSLLSEIGWGEIPIDFPKNHVLVAEIKTAGDFEEACEEAYRLTQNVEQPWTLNEGVYALVDKARSTHIGDVIKVGDDTYVCCPIGWELVTSREQRVERG